MTKPQPPTLPLPYPLTLAEILKAARLAFAKGHLLAQKPKAYLAPLRYRTSRTCCCLIGAALPPALAKLADDEENMNGNTSLAHLIDKNLVSFPNEEEANKAQSLQHHHDNLCSPSHPSLPERVAILRDILSLPQESV